MAGSKSAFRVDCEKYFVIYFGIPEPPLLKRLRFFLLDFGFQCVAVYRLGRFSRGLARKSRLLALPFRLLYMILALVMRFVHHVHIDNDSIGPGFYIGHIGTIYIGPMEIGHNFSVSHNVTIGLGQTRGQEGVPRIGNDVWIGTGAVIYGAISIGDGVAIDANATVSRDIPPRSFVSGNPGRVVMQDYDNSKLLGFSVG